MFAARLGQLPFHLPRCGRKTARLPICVHSQDSGSVPAGARPGNPCNDCLTRPTHQSEARLSNACDFSRPMLASLTIPMNS